MAAGFRGGLSHRHRLIVSGATTVDGEDVFESSGLGKRPHYIEVEVSESLIGKWKFTHFQFNISLFRHLTGMAAFAEGLH